MSKLQSVYHETKSYSDNIMENVTNTLKKSKISYKMKSNGKEVTVNHENQSKESIIKLLKKKLNIADSIFNLMLEITQVNSNIYIRQKLQ